MLALKGNQGKLHQAVVQLFDQARQQQFRGIEHNYDETQERGHGRTEMRRYWVMGQTQYLVGAENWAKLTTIGCVESQRHSGGKTTCETRYYRLSLTLGCKALCSVGTGSLGHGESTALDSGCRLPRRQARSTLGHSGENLAVICHLAVNLLTQEKSAKGGTRANRLKAGWDDHYLLKILSQSSRSVSKR